MVRIWAHRNMKNWLSRLRELDKLGNCFLLMSKHFLNVFLPINSRWFLRFIYTRFNNKTRIWVKKGSCLHLSLSFYLWKFLNFHIFPVFRELVGGKKEFVTPLFPSVISIGSLPITSKLLMKVRNTKLLLLLLPLPTVYSLIWNSTLIIPLQYSKPWL